MKTTVIAILTLLLGVGVAGAGETHHPETKAVNDPRFEFLKSLEGSWIGTSDSTEMSGGRFEFRLTAGGTAVEEREMIGTPMEMLTVYTMDGKELVGTHYCAIGNQPRVKAAKRVVDHTLDFDCDGKPGNAASHDDEHIHGWTIRLGEDGSLHYSAQLIKAGEVQERPTMVLHRETAD